MATSRALGLGLLALVALSGECGLSCLLLPGVPVTARDVTSEPGMKLTSAREHEMNRHGLPLAVGLLTHKTEWLKKLCFLLETPQLQCRYFAALRADQPPHGACPCAGSFHWLHATAMLRYGYGMSTVAVAR
eukprot:1156955-Pelagomonas_calceolata.AAC.4